MKKTVLLCLSAAIMLSSVSCAEHPIETTPVQTTMETSVSEQIITQKAPIFDYAATVIDANGKENVPYKSYVYFVLDGRVSDGPLMFLRMEEILPDWIEKGLIPDISLDEDSDVKFTCGECSSITHSGRFRMFVQMEDGTISQVYESEKAKLAAIYVYGKEHFAGKSVYITYGCMVSDLTNEGDRNDVSCIFRTNF